MKFISGILLTTELEEFIIEFHGEVQIIKQTLLNYVKKPL